MAVGSMIGNIYKIIICDDKDGWGYYHLMPLDIRQAIGYRNSDLAAHCLVLETGERYEIYADVLQNEGKLVA